MTDVPAPGDYDGVGRTEMAVFRPASSQWFVLNPLTGGGHLVGTFGAKNFVDGPTAAPVGAVLKLKTIPVPHALSVGASSEAVGRPTAMAESTAPEPVRRAVAVGVSRSATAQAPASPKRGTAWLVALAELDAEASVMSSSARP